MRLANLTALVLAASLAACGGSSSSGSVQDQSRNAMPRSENLQMTSPSAPKGSSLKDGSDGTSEQASTAGSASAYFGATVGLSAVVNGSTAFMLGILKAVTDLPATNCTEDTCTWGPGSGALEANNYKLVVTKKTNPDRFEYALSGQAKSKPSSDFVVFLTGTAVPSDTPHRGSGQLVLDNDARNRIDNPGTDTGKLTINYSNTTLLSVTAVGTGLRDNDHPGQQINVAYQFGDKADGGGELDVGFRNLTSNATLSLHSRWKATGAGRGDAKFAVGALQATASECWAAASGSFKVAYWVQTPSDPNQPTSGVETDCAYSPAVYGSVAVP